MRFLIAQGPGHYGVNIRQISDEVANKLAELHGTDAVREEPGGPVRMPHEGFEAISWIDAERDTTMIITAPAGPIPGSTRSVGFDTGWWDRGEAAIEAALKEV